MSIATKPKVALPPPRTNDRSFEVAPVESGSDALAAAGTGLAIGSFVGVLAGRSERAGVVGGIAGGVLGLMLNSISRGEQPATSGLAKAVRQGWSLGQETFARLLGYSPRSVASYEVATKLPPTVARRYVEVGRLRLALEGVMKPAFVDTWLDAPNPAFDGFTPMQLVLKGETDRIQNALYDIAYGVS